MGAALADSMRGSATANHLALPYCAGNWPARFEIFSSTLLVLWLDQRVPDQEHRSIAQSVSFTVKLRPQSHEIDVEMRVAGLMGNLLGVTSPTWVPGDYSFATFGRDLFSLGAEGGAGEPLSVQRDGWQGYLVGGATGAITLNYTANCTSWDRSEACGILFDTGGVLTGARYLRVPDYDGPYTVEYEVPDGWAIHHPSGAKQVGPTAWEYPSYELLLDTPVCFGDFDVVERDVDGTPFFYVFLDRTTGSGTRVEPFVDQVDAAVRDIQGVFGGFPFSDYTFVCSVNPSAEWGLEHLTSTMVGLGPEVFIDPDQFAVGVRVCAHEFFHAWNVRRLRPAPLDDLNFQTGSFTEGLWVAEGFTRYYEFLSCTRTGIYSPQQFFSSVVNYYRHLAALPAYGRVSPIESSLTTFLNHDDHFPGRVNDTIDYYDAGMVIAFGIDSALRTQTEGASLDTAFAGFYEQFVGRGPGYTPQDLAAYLDEQLAGLGNAVLRQASNPGTLPLEGSLQALGFDVETSQVAYLGLVLLGDTGPVIYGVLDDAPAGQSGIAAEDQITAVDGFPFELEALQWAIAHQASVSIDVVRGNQQRSYEIPVGLRSEISRVTWTGTSDQAQRIATWLRQPFAPAPGEAFQLDFYENFHGVQTVI